MSDIMDDNWDCEDLDISDELFETEEDMIAYLEKLNPEELNKKIKRVIPKAKKND